MWFQVPSNRPNVNMAYSLAIAGLGFLVTVVSGHYIVAFLRARKIGKQVRIEGPERHLTKTGTPTMGGIMVTISAFVLTFIFDLYDRLSMFLPLGVLLCCGVLGAVDDYLSLVGERKSWLQRRFPKAIYKEDLSQIILPLAKPALASVALFEFLNRWRDFFGPLIFLTRKETYTISLGLNFYRMEYDTAWALMMAMAVCVTIPIIFLFFLVQRTFIQGMTSGAIKA